jgi:hypothetical protein
LISELLVFNFAFWLNIWPGKKKKKAGDDCIMMLIKLDEDCMT